MKRPRLKRGARPSRWRIREGLRRNLEAAGLEAPPRSREFRWRLYREFRTGLTFTEVARMTWVASTDYRDWPRRTRGFVLWTWWKIKQDLWREQERREDEVFLQRDRADDEQLREAA